VKAAGTWSKPFAFVGAIASKIEYSTQGTENAEGTPPVQGTCALTAILKQICEKIPPIYPNERNMQKDSVYLPHSGCYAETICLFTRFGVICGNFLSKNKLDQR